MAVWVFTRPAGTLRSGEALRGDVSDNASLDEFARGTDDERDPSPERDPEEETESVDGTGPSTADGPAAGSGPALAVPTYLWTPEGAACERCGETAARRWRCGDDVVCSTCKTW